MSNKTLFFIALAALLIGSCAPERDDDIQLPPASGAPEFSVAYVEGDSNRIVITDLTAGGFQRLWDLPGGQPKVSTKAVDTVIYPVAGDYTITLFVSRSDGSGTTYASKKVNIPTDAPLACTGKLALLTGCGSEGRCWAFSHAAGAVKVGPSYDDYSWFTSPDGGLQAEQYDDGFCFTFDGLLYENRNNGASVNPWAGYVPQAYAPGVSDFVFLQGTGTGGRDQIVLADDQFMGVWDSDNVLDVVKLTETELIVRGRQRDQNGAPLAQGWFELTFVRQ
ncbi:MAG: PKD domain-containing protein [Saprospiraceae bacterium]|nr:PKD domain-containing protein [Saprospiraceae bacterium]